MEEIVDYIESEFPTPVLCADYTPAIDRLTRNLFSKFCYYIKVGVPTSMICTELKHNLIQCFQDNETLSGNGISVTITGCQIIR